VRVVATLPVIEAPQAGQLRGAKLTNHFESNFLLVKYAATDPSVGITAIESELRRMATLIQES
jgi:hypothetical protein